MTVLLYIGAAVSLALLIFSVIKNRQQRRRLQLELKAEIEPGTAPVHPKAILFTSLELGETVHCQTRTGTRYSFRVVDRELGYFEINCLFAGQSARATVGAYVMGTIHDGQSYPGQFIPGGEIYFQTVIEDDGIEQSVDSTTDPIDRLFRTPYDPKKDKL